MNRWERGTSKLYGTKKNMKKKKNRMEENIRRSHRFGNVRTFCVRRNEVHYGDYELFSWEFI